MDEWMGDVGWLYCSFDLLEFVFIITFEFVEMDIGLFMV